MGALAGGGAATQAHPPVGWSFSAWFSLVPLLLLLEGRRPGRAFFLGWVYGAGFFGIGMSWFPNIEATAGIPGPLAWFAFFLLILYLSVYHGIFAWGWARWFSGHGARGLWAACAWWVVLEWARARFLGGFGWLTLGHTQYRLLPLIQIAEVTGVFGVSFLVMAGNVLTAAVVGSWAARRFPDRTIVMRMGVFVLVLLGVWTFGRLRLARPSDVSGLRAAVVQGNVAQGRKWLPSEWPSILDTYLDLSREALRESPDLLIWPETAFPGYPWETPETWETIRAFVEDVRVPLLLGVVTREEGRYYNSAVLIGPDGRETARYHKMHLVPFGEYIPFRWLWPWLGRLVPMEDFSAGRRPVVFPVEGRDRAGSFAVLICFEDTVAPLARKAVAAGARILVNLTNDAWFADTAAPYQHLQAAVFRTVENRRGLIRAANTGVSCFIDDRGRVIRFVRGPDGRRTFVSGVAAAVVPWGEGTTFYTRYGDLFVLLCGLGLAAFGRRRIRKKAQFSVDNRREIA